MYVETTSLRRTKVTPQQLELFVYGLYSGKVTQYEDNAGFVAFAFENECDYVRFCKTDRKEFERMFAYHGGSVSAKTNESKDRNALQIRRLLEMAEVWDDHHPRGIIPGEWDD